MKLVDMNFWHLSKFRDLKENINVIKGKMGNTNKEV